MKKVVEGDSIWTERGLAARIITRITDLDTEQVERRFIQRYDDGLDHHHCELELSFWRDRVLT